MDEGTWGKEASVCEFKILHHEDRVHETHISLTSVIF